uniref:SET domain-containing protein n=1 Tax=Odontella aurita TaxID=265563 RepID=A0A7S4JNF3_9STRA|mmetsp:Transcript_50092/g.150786  ORF Transcript_50092/g.150786 Transcript_50092/m.150786 type:complete len:1024 (+) Transcript_50092:164-3235(+)
MKIQPNGATNALLGICLNFIASLDLTYGAESNKDADVDSHPGNLLGQCSLFLAPSSISGAGLGVFAGRDFEIGAKIGSPGLGLQFIDPFAIYDEREVIAEYGWNSVAVGGDSESDTVFSFLPGIGTLANFHPTLSNVIPGGLTFEPTLDRRQDSGVGASTSYHNFTFIAKEYISAGHEIFASVGEGWFKYHNENNDNAIPLKEDYDSADKIVQRLAFFRENNPSVEEAQFLDILRRIKKEMINNERLKRIIPESIKQFDDATTRGVARAILKESGIQWLRQHGRCMDNIRPGISTIPGAGRGAFASRFLRVGSAISSSPLVQVMNWHEVFRIENKNEDVSDKQLMLNYCFGHRKSTLLLCPTTSVVLINHSKRSNAKIQWSDITSLENNYRFLDFDELEPKSDDLSEYNSRLSFDFIATEDILPGEEIFLDYGEEWERAWAKHESVWATPKSAAYIPSNVLNSDSSEPILLSNDTKLHHHAYLCRLEPFAREDAIPNIPEEDFRANPQILPHTWNNATQAFYRDNDYLWWWPCDVVDINADGSAFSVRVYKKSPGLKRDVIRRLRNVPRQAIKFVDKQYHSDQHLPNSFRHYIPIPDKIFPLHWKKDYTSSTDVRLGTKNTGADISERNEDNERKKYESDLRKATCGVYVARSNIKNAGKGVYAGVTVPGEGFVLEAEIPVIPVVDIDRDEQWDANDYTWSSSNFQAEYEADSAGSSQILAVNEGMMANFHPGLVNAEISDAIYDPILDRRRDPGAGAFSDYADVSYRSLHELKAGEEVFISYGEHWFQERSYLGKVPLSAHYAEANGVIASLASLQSTDDDALNDREMGQLLEIIKDGVVHNERTRVVLSNLKTAGDIRNILFKNGTAEATTENRSDEWLKTNGYCTDHIYSKASTIKQAGRGAFARRLIPKGETIIPAPLLCTWGRHMFDVPQKSQRGNINRKQLLYNYQLTHPESSVLFFPTNTAITINHSRERENARLRWSNTDRKSMYYLQRPIADLRKVCSRTPGHCSLVYFMICFL